MVYTFCGFTSFVTGLTRKRIEFKQYCVANYRRKKMKLDSS